MLVTVLIAIKNYEEALPIVNGSLELDGNNKGILVQKAVCSLQLGLFRTAVECFEKAGKIYGFSKDIFGDLAACHTFLGNYAEAERCNSQAGITDSVLYNQSLLQLRKGYSIEAWQNYEHGLLNKARIMRKGYEKFEKLPFWEPNKNFDNLVLIGEQGIGDEIMYATIFDDLLKDVKNVYYLCDPRLKPVIMNKFKSIQFLNPGEYLNVSNQAKLAVGSLPKFYRNNEKDFLNKGFYSEKPKLKDQ